MNLVHLGMEVRSGSQRFYQKEPGDGALRREGAEYCLQSTIDLGDRIGFLVHALRNAAQQHIRGSIQESQEEGLLSRKMEVDSALRGFSLCCYLVDGSVVITAG